MSITFFIRRIVLWFYRKLQTHEDGSAPQPERRDGRRYLSPSESKALNAAFREINPELVEGNEWN